MREIILEYYIQSRVQKLFDKFNIQTYLIYILCFSGGGKKGNRDSNLIIQTRRRRLMKRKIWVLNLPSHLKQATVGARYLWKLVMRWHKSITWLILLGSREVGDYTSISFWDILSLTEQNWGAFLSLSCHFPSSQLSHSSNGNPTNTEVRSWDPLTNPSVKITITVLKSKFQLLESGHSFYFGMAMLS